MKHAVSCTVSAENLDAAENPVENPVENPIDRRATGAASAFGAMIRARRKALKLRQDQLALATGVGRRFLIELEAGKPSCQLGRSLLVAEALGLTFADILAARGGAGGLAPALPPAADATGLPELPDAIPELPEPLPELPGLGLSDLELSDTELPDMEKPDGRSAGIF
jgi:transcriptional regulator with XRE-family HTH domain